MDEIRKLSTILFADISGYTKMMQSDEQQALRKLNRFKEALEHTVSRYHGDIVQYFGDGCLLSFDSTTEAVACSLSLQQTFTNHKIPVRIGMHMGEVVFHNNNAFGDGVNIASRVESMGVPGSVLFSQPVKDQINNKADFKIVPLGEFHFKNVSEPTRLYALGNAGLTVPQKDEMKGKLSEPIDKKSFKKSSLFIILGYLLIIWLGVDILNYSLKHLELSPYWSKIYLTILLGLFPSFLTYLIFKNRLTRYPSKFLYKIIVPINVMVVAGLLFFMFRSTDLGAITKQISYLDPDGTAQISRIVKQEFRTKVTLFNFEGIDVDDDLSWLGNGIRNLLKYDIQQDKAINISDEAGVIPMAGKIDKSRDYYVDGTYSIQEGIYVIHPVIHIAGNGKTIAERDFSGKDLLAILDSISIYIRKNSGISNDLLSSTTDLNLGEFTSNSIPAIRSFCEGTFAGMERAVEIDSTFAIASLELGKRIFYSDVSELDARYYLSHAFRNRNKLPFDLQYSVMSFYHMAYNDLEAAEKTLKLQLEINPDNILLNENLVRVYQQGKNFKELLKFTAAWFNEDYYSAAKEYANALLINNKPEALVSKARPFMLIYPNDESLMEYVLKAHMISRKWDSAIEVIDKMKLIRPEFDSQLAILEESVNHRRKNKFNPNQYRDFMGQFRHFYSERMATYFPHKEIEDLTLVHIPGGLGLLYPLNDSSTMAFNSWHEIEIFELAKDSNDMVYGVNVRDIISTPTREINSLFWWIDPLINSAEASLKNLNLEVGEDAYLSAIAENPNHYFLKDGLASIRYIKSKSESELRRQFESVVGSYGDRKFWIEKGRLYYKRKPIDDVYFPKMELFPISENEYINFTRQYSRMNFTYRNDIAISSYTTLYDSNSNTWVRNELQEDNKPRSD